MNPEIEALLEQVRGFMRPPKERSLFSLAARGYYENPASDLLAFFMTPDADHGFGGLFLEAFLQCMDEPVEGLSLGDVTVSREVQTAEGNRIDLFAEAADWVLVIENKIYHGQVNPFATYEAYGRTVAGKRRLLLAVLSPNGESVNSNWKPVSYRDFCTALRSRLCDALIDRAYSKWVVFAREFILHLENELYQPTLTMTPEEANFVEGNINEINKVKKLASDYRQFLIDSLKARLTDAVAGHDFTVKDDGWALRCYSDTWGRSNIAFWTSTSGKEGKMFQVNVYLVDLTEDAEKTALKTFEKMRHWRERAWLAWRTEPGFDTREAAISEACTLAQAVSSLFPNDPAPTEPV